MEARLGCVMSELAEIHGLFTILFDIPLTNICDNTFLRNSARSNKIVSLAC